MTIAKIIEGLEKFAPIELAEEWDNVGLMVGDIEAECSGVTLALDLTLDVIKQAKADGCNLIITHHPFIFHPLKSVNFETAAGAAIRELIKGDIAVYSMHTNLDKAERGLNRTLAELLGGRNIELSGVGVIFDIEPMTLAAFAKLVAAKLDDKSVRIVGAADKVIKRIFAVSGSGGSEYEEAKKYADVLLTGDLKHHNYIDAQNDNFSLCEYSHFSSEIIMQDILADELEDAGIKIKKATQSSPFRLLEEI